MNLKLIIRQELPSLHTSAPQSVQTLQHARARSTFIASMSLASNFVPHVRRSAVQLTAGSSLVKEKVVLRYQFPLKIHDSDSENSKGAS
jgi:hypothetical protein